MQKLKNMGDEILKLTNEVVIDIDGMEASVIDVMITRFPHVVKDIFKELDDKTLTTCRNVSRLCCDYLDDEKFLWVRMIQSYRNNMGISYPHWNKVLKNTPFELVKEFSVSTQQFFKDDASRNEFYWSPLQIVAEQGNFELCKYILEKTNDTKPRIKYNRDEFYYTHPILMAAKKGHEEICKVLIDNSGEKNPSDVFGMTIFHFAAKKGLTDVCKLIIKNIDNKNPAALNGCTPLHLAAEEGHLEIIRLIVETGVDKNSLFNGKTPLDLAGNFRSYTFYKLLSEGKIHLCESIFIDLKYIIGICFSFFLLLFMILLIFLLIFVVIYSCFVSNYNFSHILDALGLGSLVSWATAVPLTFIISLKRGFTGKSVHLPDLD